MSEMSMFVATVPLAHLVGTCDRKEGPTATVIMHSPEITPPSLSRQARGLAHRVADERVGSRLNLATKPQHYEAEAA